MTDPFAEWPPEGYENEIEREERRWAESPPWVLDDLGLTYPTWNPEPIHPAQP